MEIRQLFKKRIVDVTFFEKIVIFNRQSLEADELTTYSNFLHFLGSVRGECTHNLCTCILNLLTRISV